MAPKTCSLLFCFTVLPMVSSFCRTASAQDHGRLHEEPTLIGQVTRAVSPLDFDVEGLKVDQSGATFAVSEDGKVVKRNLPAPAEPPYLGEEVRIFGKIDAKTHSIHAKEVILAAPKPATVSGTGIIDRVFLPSRHIAARARGRARAGVFRQGYGAR